MRNEGRKKWVELSCLEATSEMEMDSQTARVEGDYLVNQKMRAEM
jgi:hypothetical protein